MAITILQTVRTTAANSATIAATTQGSTLVVGYIGSAGAGSTGTCSTSSATLGTAALARLAEIDAPASASAGCAAFYIGRNNPAGQTAVAITGTSLVAADAYLVVWEVAGLGTYPVLDGVSPAFESHAGNNTWESDNGTHPTTTQAAEFWAALHGAGPNSAQPDTFTPAGSWTNQAQFGWGAPGGASISGHQVTSATGTLRYSGTSADFDFYLTLVIALIPGDLPADLTSQQGQLPPAWQVTPEMSFQPWPPPGPTAPVLPLVPVTVRMPVPAARRSPLRRLAAGVKPPAAAPVPLGWTVIQDRQASLLPLRIRSQVLAGARVPPVVVAVMRLPQRPVPRARASRITAGMLPSPLQPPPAVRSRPARLLPVRRGTVTGPLAPGFTALVTPVRPVVLTAPRRGPPRAAPGRLRTGMTPGLGLSGLPPTAFLRPREPGLVPLRVRSRIIPAPSWPPLAVPVTRMPSRLARRAPGQLRTGMLPGRGLSGIPPSGFARSRQAPAVPLRTRSRIIPGLPGSVTVPVPVPVVLRSRQRIRPVPSRLIPGIFIPAAGQPAMIYPARIRPVTYRLARRPAGSLRTGMLPGTGLSGIPPAGHTRSRAAPLVPRARSRIVPGLLASPVRLPAVTRHRPPRTRPQASRLAAGLLPVPVQPSLVLRPRVPRAVLPPRSRIVPAPAVLAPVPGLPVVLRSRQAPARRVLSRLVPGILPVIPVYPAVIQQASRHRRIPSRLTRQPRMQLRAGMLPGVPPGSTGTTDWDAYPAQPRWRAGPLKAEWAAAAALPRWKAKMAPPRWELVMTDFEPVSALSLEMVNVTWTSALSGTMIDPTSPVLTVQMAFPVSSGDRLHPAQPVTWYAAAWLAGSMSIGFVAQCLVGPGGVVTLAVGQSYDVWSQIIGSPEIPKKFAGALRVY